MHCNATSCGALKAAWVNINRLEIQKKTLNLSKTTFRSVVKAYMVSHLFINIKPACVRLLGTPLLLLVEKNKKMRK